MAEAEVPTVACAGSEDASRPRLDLLQKSNNTQPPKAWKSQKTLREKDVGIELTIGKTPKIYGVFKERYADFHVHEIDLDGNIVHLASFDLPASDNGVPQIIVDDPALSQWINSEVLSKLQELQDAEDYDSKSKAVDFKVSNMDKATRTKLHQWLKHFDKLTSQTVEKADEKYIVVQHRTKDSSKFIRRPANRPRYTHCCLYKEGLDTSDAINFLSRKLRVNPNLITYAGTKDKRGKTTQRLCISNIDAKRLIDLNRISSQSKLGNFSYSPTRIALGDLKGNHFKILLKDVKCESLSTDPVENCIDSAVESLKTYGFINYFGLQRFGSYSVSTHQIGKALLHMKWEAAFDLILETKSNDPDFMKQAKRIWFEKRDPVEAKKLIPQWHRSIESNLIHGLAKYYQRKDYLSVLNCIPRNVRTLYIHAFQSYIWNRLVTHRLEHYGMKPIFGDMVYANEAPSTSWNEDSLDILNADLDVNSDNNEVPQDKYRSKPEVRTLGMDELNKYTIFDVIMPLDGTDIQYPNNGIKDYAMKLLQESELSPDYLKTYKHRSDTPSGAYRKMVILPTNVSHKMVAYNDSDCLDDLIPSDLDVLLKKGKTQDDVIAPETDTRHHNRKCLQIEFSLPSSSYATMALRELLTSDYEIDSETVLDQMSEGNSASVIDHENDNLPDRKRTHSPEEDSTVEKKSKISPVPEEIS